MALRLPALALAGALAGSTLLAVPASAAPLAAPAADPTIPVSAFDYSRFDPVSTSADWRCRGWGCRRYGHRGWRRNRIDAGDVLIGAAIIGGIAAIASANDRRDRRRDVVVVERTPDWRDDTRRYDDWRTVRRSTGSAGLDSAVDQCIARIERDVRVDAVDNVARTGRGWLVTGALFNGAPFQCRIGNDGRIEDVDFGAGGGGGDWGAASPAAYADRADGQWSDTRYADARRALGGTVPAPARVAGDYYAADNLVPPTSEAERAASATELMPAYPGGPIPGEEIPETIDGDIGG
jgi:hypothetical protein